MRNTNQRHMLGAAVAAALAVTAHQPSHAQRAGLEEIVVTAERREASLQDVPLSVATFSVDTMELKGRVRYTSANGQLELTVFGNNLTDEVYGNFATRFGGAFWDTPTGVGAVAAPQRSALGITRGRPRELGIAAQFNFGD